MVNYADNAPQGYMGDWRRGAPLGRASVTPQNKPCAAPGLISYRCASPYGWIMIGATDHDDAMREALRSSPHAERRNLQIWNGVEYVPATDEPAATVHNSVSYSPKVTLQRVRLDSGGYDPCGAYWGCGEPLYWAATDDGELDTTFRAHDRDAAKAHVRTLIPAARFHR